MPEEQDLPLVPLVCIFACASDNGIRIPLLVALPATTCSATTLTSPATGSSAEALATSRCLRARLHLAGHGCLQVRSGLSINTLAPFSRQATLSGLAAIFDAATLHCALLFDCHHFLLAGLRFLAVLAAFLNAEALGAPLVPGLRIFSPEPAAMRFLLALMFL